MEFQTLKKSHKKEIIIGTLAVCVIGGALTFATTRAKYKVTQDIPLVSGNINYKPYDFKIMAMYQSEDGTNYTEIETMPASGYTINESKSYCNMSDGNKDTTAVLKTIDGNHTIGKLKSNDRCYLYFDKKKPTSEDTLAKLNITDVKDSATTFAGVATADEGVFKVSDGMYDNGTSYYWRGAVTNNYVKFANFCWRIIRINGDGTIRLIYDGTTCHPNGTSTTDSLIQPTSGTTTYQYNASYNQSNYVGWTYSGTSQRTLSGTASNAKAQTEKWFNANITGTNLSSVADGKFCNDRDAQSGNTWAINGSTFYYAAYKRTITDRKPTLSCPSGDVYTAKVGAITADEVMFAGGWNANNTSYYLYNGQNYWTMSPSYWYSGGAVVFFVRGSDGSLDYTSVAVNRGLRPVINLRSDTLFATRGTGTQSNPYVVS